MKYSYWGEETTAEMNDGDNPKNIMLTGGMMIEKHK